MKKILISLIIIFFCIQGCNKRIYINPKKYNATIDTNYINSIHLIGCKKIQNIDMANDYNFLVDFLENRINVFDKEFLIS